MTNILNKATVLVLNRNWQAINVRTPQEAFCMMATNVATALEIEFEAQGGVTDDVLPLPVGRGEGRTALRSASDEGGGEGSASSLGTPSIRPVSWEEWITL